MGDSGVIGAGLRLGKKAAVHDPRTLKLARYVERRRLPRIPKSHNLSKRTLVAFPVLGPMRNSGKHALGCCTCAAKAHMEQTFSVCGGKPWRPTDDQIVEAYNRINGGVDEGASMLDALKDWRNVGLGGNKIFAFASIDHKNHDQVRTAHYLFGGLYIGLNLPVSAQSQEVWDLVPGPAGESGSWGGHAANVVDYDAKGVTIVTWGQLQRMTWAFLDAICDEMYAVIEEDYLGSDKRSPQGFSLAKLASDLQGLG